MAPLLDARGVGVRVGDCPIIEGVDLAVEAGSVCALLGPNGAGKTTLLKAILGLVSREGEVRVGGEDLDRLDGAARARLVGYVPQISLLTARLTGREVVALGRYAHRGAPVRGRGDAAAIADALEATDCAHLTDRAFSVCSGGERARLLLARALATEAPVLLLDEPAAALDLAHALHLHALLRRLADEGRAIVVVQHQLGDALRWSDDAVVLHRGRRVACGPVAGTLSDALLRDVFGLVAARGGVSFELAPTHQGGPDAR